MLDSRGCRVWVGLATAALGLAFCTPVRAAQPAFTFAVVGDRTGGAVDEIYERVMEEVSLVNPDLIVTVGDHIEGYTADSTEIERQWDHIVDVMDRTGIECHLTAGNHDIWDGPSRRIYQRRFGNPNWAFKHGNCVFLSIDVSMCYTAEAVPPETMTWLRRQLDKAGDKQVFVFYHKPFWCEDFTSGRPNAFHEIFKEYGVTAVFTGHYHRHFYTEKDGIRYFGVSSSGGSLAWGGRAKGAFYEYLLAKVDGDSLIVRVVEPDMMLAPDVVTMEDAVRIAGLEARTVGMSEIVAEDLDHLGPAEVEISIQNGTGQTLRDTVEWSLRGNWIVEPPRSYIEVPPGDTGTLTVLATPGAPVFPVPVLSLNVTPGDGGVVDVSVPLNVRRLMRVRPSSSGIRIDGSLDDPGWSGAASESSYFGGAPQATDGTLVRLLHDGDRVYIAVECKDGRMDSVSGRVTEHDGFGAYNDYVMFLFEPVPGSGEFYQVAVNPIGTVFDRRIEICPFGTYVLHPEWDAPLEAAARLEDDRWVVEAALPVSALGVEAPVGGRWGYNFRRTHKRLGLTSDFETPYRYDSDHLGIVQFE